MTDTYNDTTGSRKKFLIPLVVLLLCAVSLTGAGYAYNSSVTVNDNSGDTVGLDFTYTGTAPIIMDSKVAAKQIVNVFENNVYGYVDTDSDPATAPVWKLTEKKIGLDSTGAKSIGNFSLKSEDAAQVNEVTVAVSGITFTGVTNGNFNYKNVDYKFNTILSNIVVTVKDSAGDASGTYTITMADDGATTITPAGAAGFTLVDDTAYNFTVEVVFNFNETFVLTATEAQIGAGAGAVDFSKALKDVGFSIEFTATPDEV